MLMKKKLSSAMQLIISSHQFSLGQRNIVYSSIRVASSDLSTGVCDHPALGFGRLEPNFHGQQLLVTAVCSYATSSVNSVSRLSIMLTG